MQENRETTASQVKNQTPRAQDKLGNKWRKKTLREVGSKWKSTGRQAVDKLDKSGKPMGDKWEANRR